MHKILILGPQGSGKGTQAELISKALGIPALSMGQLFRDEARSGSEIGEQIAKIIDNGNLVPGELAFQILKKRLEQPDTRKGYVLDGYPRNKEQFEVFQSVDRPTVVLFVDVPREESLKRLVKRAEIEGRADDTPEFIEKRLRIYEEQTKPVIELYRKEGLLQVIDGNVSKEMVHQAIMQVLGVKV